MPTTTHPPLTISGAVALGVILRAAQGGHNVVWLDAVSGDLREGVARHIVEDSGANFPRAGADVRDCMLRITSWGLEVFLEVPVLIDMVHRGEFAIRDA